LPGPTPTGLLILDVAFEILLSTIGAFSKKFVDVSEKTLLLLIDPDGYSEVSSKKFKGIYSSVSSKKFFIVYLPAMIWDF